MTKSADASATLFVVGTPIGNLSDITYRAVETLRAVGLVAAEDTRRSRALLTHLGISGKRFVSIESHVTSRAIQKVLQALEDGTSIALVTDAGMPAISDPGGQIVAAAAARGWPVTVIPGPSAVTTAAALSGLVEGSFLFVGFLPRRGKRRKDALGRIHACVDPVILFEAPNRCRTTLTELTVLMPSRRVCVTRELTKLHEEAVRGTLESLEAREWRGEICIVLGAAEMGEQEEPDLASVDERIAALLDDGSSTKTVLAQIGSVAGLSKRELYARIEALRAIQDTQ